MTTYTVTRADGSTYQSAMPTYATIRDAEAAGWIRPRVARYLRGNPRYSRRYRVAVTDVSGMVPGGRAFGYDFEISVVDDPTDGEITVTPVARSVTVSLTQERNAGMGTGAYLAMFRRQDVEHALEMHARLCDAES